MGILKATSLVIAKLEPTKTPKRSSSIFLIETYTRTGAFLHTYSTK